jgi:putative membrane protein
VIRRPVRARPSRLPRRGGGWAALLVVGAPSPASAHHPGGGGLHPEHLALLPLALIAGAYLWAARRVRGSPTALPGWRIGAFLAGAAALAVALLPPLDGMAARLLSGHMGQHLLLSLVAAPLLVLGAPLTPLVRALPIGPRRATARVAGRALSAGGGWGSARWLVGATTAYVMVLWAWHVPAFYQAALRSTAVHALQHVLLFGTAVLFWWSVAGAARRGAHGAGIMAVFLSGLVTGGLAAILTFSERVWYPWYTAGAGGLSPLEDQQVAGALMWVPGGVVHGAVSVALFVGWLALAERRAAAIPVPVRPTALQEG